MYGIISNPNNYEDIKKVIDDQILFKKIGILGYDEVLNTLQKAEAVSLNVLIIDMAAIERYAELALVKALDKYRIRHEETRIIILAPGRVPGDETMGKLAFLGIGDIVAPKIPEPEEDENEDDLYIDLGFYLQRQLNKTIGYSDIRRWRILADLEEPAREEVAAGAAKEKVKKEIIEKTIVEIQEKILSTITIAVAGTEKGVGCSHTSISIAFYLARYGYCTALIEMKDEGIFLSIEDEYKDIKQGQLNSFRLDGVDFYKYNTSELLDILQQDYKYVVMDFGANFIDNEYFSEMQRANAKIIVSGVKDWQIEPLQKVIQETKIIRNCLFYATFSDIELFKVFQERMKGFKTYKAPFCPDPFKDYPELHEVYSNMLQGVLPSNAKMKKENIIKKVFSRFGG